MNILLIVFIFLIIIIILYILNKKYRQKNIDVDVDVVIARYNESLDWLYKIDEDKLMKMNIIVYNKNPHPFAHPRVDKIINLPNVGKCDHTYLYHIVNKYDSLADVTIFLPGSVDMEGKWNKALVTIDKVLETNDTAFVYPGGFEDVKKDFYDFTLEEWRTSNTQNVSLNDEIKTTKCNPYPYGKWFEKWFEKDGNRLIIKHTVFHGVFSVSRRHIKNRSLDFYKELITDVDYSSNPECGHFIERSWIAIFDPIEEKYFY